VNRYVCMCRVTRFNDAETYSGNLSVKKLGPQRAIYSPSQIPSRRFENLPNASNAPFAQLSTPWESQGDKDHNGAGLRACGCVCSMLIEVTACIQNDHALQRGYSQVGLLVPETSHADVI
jgi:hypothetical protein